MVGVAGFDLFHDPLNVRLNAWPVDEVGGVKSNVPKTSALSLSRAPGMPPMRPGTRAVFRMSSRRDTESDETPAACNPNGDVLSRL